MTQRIFSPLTLMTQFTWGSGLASHILLLLLLLLPISFVNVFTHPVIPTNITEIFCLLITANTKRVSVWTYDMILMRLLSSRTFTLSTTYFFDRMYQIVWLLHHHDSWQLYIWLFLFLLGSWKNFGSFNYFFKSEWTAHTCLGLTWPVHVAARQRAREHAPPVSNHCWKTPCGK